MSKDLQNSVRLDCNALPPRAASMSSLPSAPRREQRPLPVIDLAQLLGPNFRLPVQVSEERNENDSQVASGDPADRSDDESSSRASVSAETNMPQESALAKLGEEASVTVKLYDMAYNIATMYYKEKGKGSVKFVGQLVIETWKTLNTMIHADKLTPSFDFKSFSFTWEAEASRRVYFWLNANTAVKRLKEEARNSTEEVDDRALVQKITTAFLRDHGGATSSRMVTQVDKGLGAQVIKSSEDLQPRKRKSTSTPVSFTSKPDGPEPHEVVFRQWYRGLEMHEETSAARKLLDTTLRIAIMYSQKEANAR